MLKSPEETRANFCQVRVFIMFTAYSWTVGSLFLKIKLIVDKLWFTMDYVVTYMNTYNFICAYWKGKGGGVFAGLAPYACITVSGLEPLPTQ